MKLNFTLKLNFLNLILLSLLLTACDDRNNNKSNFTVTADTIIEPGSEISKYVTQEEVDSFAFRYWDIDTYPEDNITKDILRNLLKSKDTNKVLKFLKDNNLSIDVRMKDNTTPLMHSSFYNDENTVKKLINLGANPHLKDKYGLSPMSYAISTNSVNVAKVLLDSGVKFEENIVTQANLDYPLYNWIDKIIIDGDKIEIVYTGNWQILPPGGPRGATEIFGYVVYGNFIDMAKLILESGYKPYPYFGYSDEVVVGNSIYDIFPKEEVGNAMDIELEEYKNRVGDDFNLDIFIDSFSYNYSLYSILDNIPNHEPMLNLLLEHNISGQPSKELLKKEYDECYKGYIYRYNLKQKYIKENINQKVKHLDFYLKHCSDENTTFKSVREFINYKNEYNKDYAIDSFLYSYKDDPTKVIYIDNNKSNR